MNDIEFFKSDIDYLRKQIKEAFDAGFNAGIDSEFKCVENSNKYRDGRRSRYLRKVLGRKNNAINNNV